MEECVGDGPPLSLGHPWTREVRGGTGGIPATPRSCVPSGLEVPSGFLGCCGPRGTGLFSSTFQLRIDGRRDAQRCRASWGPHVTGTGRLSGYRRPWPRLQRPPSAHGGREPSRLVYLAARLLLTGRFTADEPEPGSGRSGPGMELSLTLVSGRLSGPDTPPTPGRRQNKLGLTDGLQGISCLRQISLIGGIWFETSASGPGLGCASQRSGGR